MDDDFQDMLDAVLDAIKRDAPHTSSNRSPHSPSKHEDPKRYKDQKHERSGHAEANREKRNVHERSENIRSRLGVRERHKTKKRTFTRSDLNRALSAVDKALFEHGGIRIPRNTFKYIDKLYPELAMKVILLSKTRYWPGCDIDAVLEGILLDWISQNINDMQLYVQDLLDAIKETKCMAGALLRLNLNAIAQPSYDTITIITPDNKHTTIREQPRKSVFTGSMRRKVISFLQQQDKYVPNINTIYNSIQHIHTYYNNEQALLGWMGYIVLRAILEKSDGVKLANDRLYVKKGTKYLTEDVARKRIQ